MQSWFTAAVEPPAGAATEEPDLHWWFVFRDGELLLDESASRPTVLRGPRGGDLRPGFARELYLGRIAGHHAWAAELPAGAPLAAHVGGWTIRALYDHLGEDLFTLAGRAAQLLAWDRDHRFCGRCGAATALVPGERARRCAACGLVVYPRLSPAIIVLIERAGQVLLARGRGMPTNRYGVIAGFVEVGESLEEAVRREIDEETGLAVREIRYFASQPWPFPHTIMIGFTAQYDGGEIDRRDGELADAAWFGLDALPLVPPRFSIARRLLDAWATGRGGTIDQP